MGNQNKKWTVGRILLRIVVLFGLVSTAIFVWFWSQRGTDDEKTVVRVPVKVMRPVFGDLMRTVTVPGYIEAASVVTIVPKVSGTLSTLLHDVGDVVLAGSVIGTVDQEPYQLSVNQAKAALDGARSVYERTKQLAAAGATSQQLLDQARVQFENTSAYYDLAALNMSYTTIVSPISGTVIKRHVSQGSMVSSAVAVLTLSDNTQLYINANVPERYIGLFTDQSRFTEGDVHIPAIDRSGIPVVVRTVSPYVNVQTKTFAVRAEVDRRLSGNEGELMPGLYAAVTFIVERHEGVISLPFSALSGGDTLWYVDDDETARFLTFAPQFSSESHFEIPPQYREVRFIEAGQHFMTAGTPVAVVQENK